MIGGVRPELSLQESALLLRVELRRLLAEHQMTFQQWAVVREIYAQEVMPEGNRKGSVAAIAARLQLNRPTMARLVEQLRHDGWIELLPDPQDERSQCMILTAQSRNSYTMWQAASTAVVEESWSTYSRHEQQLLMELLLRMVYQMEREQAVQLGI
ncbi:MarR family winged helix-turn-helix transcriptional regulator [Paenibacillus taiwanensis]|uniref:MarR family winged helix-turn-helix transcriptional regulator n=1 Tax=Paenibacillus taiwanensis TaxID=401638 RepID=UPI00042A11B2|nr:helix-turn-helix domain-containing protein [Paenibacillus taiwanensis]